MTNINITFDVCVCVCTTIIFRYTHYVQNIIRKARFLSTFYEVIESARLTLIRQYFWDGHQINHI